MTAAEAAMTGQVGNVVVGFGGSLVRKSLPFRRMPSFGSSRLDLMVCERDRSINPHPGLPFLCFLSMITQKRLTVAPWTFAVLRTYFGLGPG